MSHTIYGDLLVKRTIEADRRVNQGLSKETITSLRSVVVNDFAWLQIINATTQDVVLPDALTLTEGWSIAVMTDIASSASVNVKSYHISSPVLIKNILVNRAYRFTLLNNTSAAGVWHVDFLEESDTLPAERYADSFNATSDWTGPSGGYYTRTILEATHGMGTQPNIQVFSGAVAPFIAVGVDEINVIANGDIEIIVPQTPDSRFAGKAIIM